MTISKTANCANKDSEYKSHLCKKISEKTGFKYSSLPYKKAVIGLTLGAKYGIIFY